MEDVMGASKSDVSRSRFFDSECCFPYVRSSVYKLLIAVIPSSSIFFILNVL